MNRQPLSAEDGQAIVLVVAILAVLIGFGALVIDGGRWFHANRRLQTAADAAALAGVQNLPADQTAAAAVANSYTQTNYAGAMPTISFPSTPSATCNGTNCIRVVENASAAGTLAKIFGSVFNTVNVSAKAAAALTVPSMLKDVAPVAVKNTIACTTPSCFGTSKTVSFDESNVASSTIGLINLTCHALSLPACANNNNVGAQDLKDWIVSGFPDALPAGQWYGVKTGQNVGPIKQGFDAKLGARLFFPVFDTTSSIGSVWYFHVIGWSAFVIDQVVSWSPSDKRLRGRFVTFTTSELPAGVPPSGTDFGVRIITLIE